MTAARPGRPSNADAATSSASPVGRVSSRVRAAPREQLARSIGPNWSIAASAIACVTGSGSPTWTSAARTASANGPPPGTTSTGPGIAATSRHASSTAVDAAATQQAAADLDHDGRQPRPSTESATAAATSPAGAGQRAGVVAHDEPAALGGGTHEEGTDADRHDGARRVPRQRAGDRLDLCGLDRRRDRLEVAVGELLGVGAHDPRQPGAHVVR